MTNSIIFTQLKPNNGNMKSSNTNVSYLQFGKTIKYFYITLYEINPPRVEVKKRRRRSPGFCYLMLTKFGRNIFCLFLLTKINGAMVNKRNLDLDNPVKNAQLGEVREVRG